MTVENAIGGANVDQNCALEQRLKELEEKYSQLALLYAKLQEVKEPGKAVTPATAKKLGDTKPTILEPEVSKTAGADVDATQGTGKTVDPEKAADAEKVTEATVEDAGKASTPGDALKVAAEAVEKVTEPVTEETKKTAKANAEETKKPTPRIRVVQHVYDRANGSYVDRNAGEPPIISTEEEQSAALLRKDIEDPEDSEIKIYGKNLRYLLQKKMRYHPWHWSFKTLEYDAPYEPIIFNWDLLREEAEKTGGSEEESEGRADLKLLLDAILQGSGDPKLDNYLKNRASDSETITFENLWTIFPPGTLVHARPFMKQDQILLVYHNVDPWPTKSSTRSDRYSPWILRCFMYDWNGSIFVRRVVSLSFDEFTGPKPISALHIRPLDRCEDAEEIKSKLLERGKKFKRYCTLSRDERMMKYSGRAIIDKSGLNNSSNSSEKDDDDVTVFQQSTTPSQVGGTETDVSSEVMVDFESYYKYAHPWSSIGKYVIDDEEGECQCSECRANEFQKETWKVNFDGKVGADDEVWDDLQYILCPPRVLGYILRDKVWAQLDIDRLEHVPTLNQEDAFMNGLKLAGEDNGYRQKKLLLGLVKYHGLNEATKKSRDYKLKDLVAEKGHGLVILLYGPPGVGKTSTAQTIAVAAGKPLLTVGVTDVGTTAKNVQKNLDKIFDLATTWGSVLLIDEADVFLQSRSRGELGSTTERNALVSVFLRVLEYYQGILILTTNQIAQFDVAVQSRIHIALKYESLDADQTRDIFNSFLKQFEEKNMIEPREKEAIKKWASTRLSRMKLDGRQIRNVVTSAMGLAKADGNRKLREEDLLDISDIVTSFKEDLNYQMIQYKESQNKSKSL